MQHPIENIYRGQIKLRGDEKTSDQLGPEEYFVRIAGQLYPLSRVTTAPPILDSQLKILQYHHL